MNETSANPIVVALFFIIRCLIPLVVLFGISFLLRKLGLVSTDTAEPNEAERDAEEAEIEKEELEFSTPVPPSRSGSARSRSATDTKVVPTKKKES